MRNVTQLVLVAAGAASLGACGSAGIANRERPDEFAVQRQAPLVVPPDFELVPPQPGAPRPAEGTAAQQALDALFGGPAPRSAIETSALRRAGEAEQGLRSSVDHRGARGRRPGRARRHPGLSLVRQRDEAFRKRTPAIRPS
jgi:hypothetical protein